MSVGAVRWCRPSAGSDGARIDSSTAAASSAPAAPSAWPVTPLVLVIGGTVGAEHAAHGLRLGGIVQRRRRAVGVDLGDVVGLQPGVGEGQLHAVDGARCRRVPAR